MKGKQKKKYDVYQTPYQALKKVTAVGFLKPGVTFTQLNILSKCQTQMKMSPP